MVPAPLCVKPLKAEPAIFPDKVNAPVLPSDDADDKLRVPDKVDAAPALLFSKAPPAETPVPFR